MSQLNGLRFENGRIGNLSTFKVFKHVEGKYSIRKLGSGWNSAKILNIKASKLQRKFPSLTMICSTKDAFYTFDRKEGRDRTRRSREG